MQKLVRYLQPAIMSGIMAFLMTSFVTWKNLGLPPDFISRWMQAFLPAWPLAFLSALIALPIARAGTAKILALLGEKQP